MIRKSYGLLSQDFSRGYGDGRNKSLARAFHTSALGSCPDKLSLFVFNDANTLATQETFSLLRTSPAKPKDIHGDGRHTYCLRGHQLHVQGSASAV